MKNIVLTFIFLIIIHLGFAQNLQLQYSGNNQKIIEAVTEANKILNNPEFYRRIDSINKFDNTTFSGAQIVNEMKSVKTVEVVEYFKRHTRTNAKTETKISLNIAKLQRYSDPIKNLASITNTLIHESVHAVDWIVNQHWDYTHRTQYEEIPPISAPYVIGAIGESFVK